MRSDWKLHIVYGIFGLVYLSTAEVFLGPFRLPHMLWAAIVIPILAGLLAFLYFHRWEPGPIDVGESALKSWPHDPDPTEALTRPMSDPYATRPYDPRSDVTTVIMHPLDDSRMLWPDEYDNAPTEWDG